jgi:Flp pilus assembly protein TadD
MPRNFLYKPTFHIFLLFILGILGYSNTLNVPFQFDDVTFIVESPVVKNLKFYITPLKAIAYMNPIEDYPMLINRYIGSLTFALNYKIHGLDVTGYHLVNILIHLINSLLVYWFVYLIFLTLASGAGGDNSLFLKHASTIALFSSLLFVTHPIQTQAVTYIIQRFASLATMLYLFSIIMYIKARLTLNGIYNSQGKKIKVRAYIYYLTALFAAVLGMKTKEITFTLPVMIVIYEILFFNGATKRRILYLVPFILSMLIIPATLIWFADISGGSGSVTRLQTDMTRFDYLFTELRVIMTYIRLMFFPVGQNLDYDYPLFHSIFEPEVFLSFMALLTICFTITYSFWRYRITLPLTRVIFFGTAWFFVTLSIESSIIPIIDVIFEHRMYLPSIGLFLTISTLIVMIVERCQQKWVERVVFLSVIIISLIFMGTTYSRNNVWRDRVVLWQDVVNKSPEKARGYNNLGHAHYENGNLDSAIKYFKKSISLDDSFYNYNAYMGLGKSLGKLGQLNEAIKVFREGKRINPHDAEIHINLGITFGKLGRINEAIKEFREALRINPNLAEAHNSIGIGLAKLGRTNEAIQEFREALRINPGYAEALNNLQIVEMR